MFKKKGIKVHLKDNVPSDGLTPAGNINWKIKAMKKVELLYEDNLQFKELIDKDLIKLKFSKIKRGSRIHRERLEGLLKQVDHLTKEEIELFLCIMYNREAALAWDFTERGIVNKLIALL